MNNQKIGCYYSQKMRGIYIKHTDKHMNLFVNLTVCTNLSGSRFSILT